MNNIVKYFKNQQIVNILLKKILFCNVIKNNKKDKIINII